MSNLLQQGARIATQFIVTPIIIRGLGLPLYGAWMMIQQTVGYLAVGDMRPAATLKFSLAVRQHSIDEDEKRRLVGAAVRIWLYMFPVILTAGAVIVWLTPRFIRVSPEYVFAVRVAMSIVIVHVALDRILSLPSNVLIGSNLEYRSMGLNAASLLLTGLMLAMAVQLGLGLIGVACASVIGALIYGFGRFLVARRAISWFGIARASRAETLSFLKLSGWISVASLSHLFLSSADLMVVGVLFGPATAAVYGTTAAVLRIAVSPLSELLASGGVGLTGLCGEQQWERVSRLRLEMQLLSIILTSVIGAGVIALNRDFLQLWTRREIYAGTLVNVLLVVLMLVTLVYRADRVVATALMEFRILSTVVSGIAVLALGAGAVVAYVYEAPAAIPFGLGAAHVLAQIVLEVRMKNRTGGRLRPDVLPLIRPLFVTALLYGGAIVFERRVHIESWPMLVVAGLTVSVVAVSIMLALGVRPQERALLVGRLRQGLRSVGGSVTRRR